MTLDELRSTKGDGLRGVADNVRNQLRQLTRSTLDACRPSPLVNTDRFQGHRGRHSTLITAMKILAVLVLAICAVAGVTALATRRRVKHEIASLCDNNIDQHARLDRLVERIRNRLRDEEPFSLPTDIAPLRLHDGVMWGLSNFELRHPPQLVCGNGYANLSMLIGLVQPHVRYRWNFTPIPGVTGQFIAHADRATVDVFLQAPLNSTNAKASVKSLKVTELSQIWVKVPSVPVVSWVASQIGNLGTMINRKNLKSFLQENLRTSIQKTLDKEPL
uniref:Putative conserved plasma membrane protein n=1 Tax=Rhipicephalus microplus TaxID=6941 RepID=A0A6M2CTV3_RHIMP